jgi:antitoxin YefM
MRYTQINLAEDICPVSEFRADINSILQKTKSTHRPIVLTQHGKSTAVLMDINDYQSLLYERELLEEIRIGLKQADEGKVCSTTKAKERIMKRFQHA